MAHAHDLRDEVDEEYGFTDEAAGDLFVHTFVQNWRSLDLSDKLFTLFEFAEKLTVAPSEMSPEDIEDLRDAGWTDVAIHDAVQVISYFNYINRVADALGVENESFVKNWGNPGIDI